MISVSGDMLRIFRMIHYTSSDISQPTRDIEPCLFIVRLPLV